MNLGTNDYGVKKLVPSETIVSRTLQTRYRSFSNVIWRTGKPALDSEWNLINDMSSEMLTSFIQSKVPSGWLELGKNKFDTNSEIANTFQYYSQKNQQQLVTPNAIVNGWPILVAGTNYTDTILNSIILSAAGVTARTDFVFLEVWRAQLRSRDQNNNPIAQNKPDVDHIWKFGNVQFTGTNLDDDIIDTAIKPSVNGIETSQRVQIQCRIRSVSDVDFADTDSSGFETSAVQGQGANVNPQIAGYQFTNMVNELGDCGLWRAGAGDEASMIALGSVDGYSYAIPMFKIFRRNTTAYSDTTNQNGNLKVLSDLISDRPDNKFNDGIDSTDIIDLRNKVFIGEMNYQEIMDYNLDKLFSGKLRSNKLQSIYYNSISNSDVPGYVDFLNNQGASGKRTLWSDAPSEQDNIFAEVKVSTTTSTLDVYRATGGTGPWAVGNTIKIKIPKLPVGTVIKSTPRVYVENTTKSVVIGSWSGCDTLEATFTISNISGLNSYDLWVYYDIGLPVGQGISQVPDDILRINYTNYAAFGTGTVVRGERLEPQVTRFQDLFDHPFENKDDTQTYVETSVVQQRKQLKISPLIQSTSSRNGGTRLLEVETLSKSTTQKTVYVPYALQHLRGVYTSASSGTEVAMQQKANENVSDVDVINNQILISQDYFIGQLTSLKHDPSGAFSGSEVELLISGTPTGLYGPVFEHRAVTTDYFGTRVMLYTSTGVIFNIPPTALSTHFRWSGSRIKVKQGGYGYSLNGFIIDCTESDNVASFSAMSDRDQLWIDCDYFGAPKSDAELRIIYEYTPYQGSDVGSQNLTLLYKRERGFFFNNGTGGGTIDLVGSNGTSNYFYSPLSPRLPGSLYDYLRDGTAIEVSSCGDKRFESDMWTAAYDVYGYLGGTKIWTEDYVMPSTPEITQRGFLTTALSGIMLEAIFENPKADAAYAEFILPILVKNKITGKVYLMIQIGNKGVHKYSSQILVDLFALDERILIK